MPEATRAPSTPVAPRRRGGAPPGAGGTAWGWIVKIVLLGLADALAVTGLLDRDRRRGVGLRDAARGHARRRQRRVPPAPVHPAQVPRAGRVLPRDLRALPGAVHGRTRRPRTTAPVTSSRSSRRSTRSRASRSVGWRAPTAYDVTPLAGPDGDFAGYGLYDPTTEELFLGTTESIDQLTEPAELPGAHHHAAHVRRECRRPHRRTPGQRRHAHRLPVRPRVVRDARRVRGVGDPDHRRSGIRGRTRPARTTRTPTR